MPWDGATWVPHETMEGNVTTLVDVAQYANDVTSNAFGVMALISLFIILFTGFSFYTKKMESSLAGATYVTAVVSFLMAALDMVMDEASIIHAAMRNDTTAGTDTAYGQHGRPLLHARQAEERKREGFPEEGKKGGKRHAHIQK